MKISKYRLRQLIKEETSKVLSEAWFSNKDKAEEILGKVSNKIMRGSDAPTQRQFVSKWLAKIANATSDDLRPWEGNLWPEEDDREFARLFTLKGDEQTLGGELEPTSVKILDAALKKRGV